MTFKIFFKEKIKILQNFNIKNKKEQIKLRANACKLRAL